MSRISSDFIKTGNSNGRVWSNDHDRLLSGNERQQREQQNEQRGRMDIDRDEAEAGSILISMASYASPYRASPAQEITRPSSTRSMSIQNLLDTKPDSRISPSSSSPSLVSSYQQEQNNTGNDYDSPTMMDYRCSEMNTRTVGRSGAKTEIKQEPVHASFNSVNKPTYPQRQLMTDPKNYDSKQTPKIKRNALHAYISYMIYTDLSHHQNSFGTKLATPRSTPTGFAVAMNNNNNNNNDSSDHSASAYPFPGMTFRKMGNILSEGSHRSDYSNTFHRPRTVPNSTGSMALLLDQQQKRDNYNNHLEDIANQVPQECSNNSTIIHKPLTAYLHPARTSTTSEQLRGSSFSPLEDFRPQSSASMPILPGMPPNPHHHHHHHHHHHGKEF